MRAQHPAKIALAMICLCGPARAADDQARERQAVTAVGCDIKKGDGDEPALALRPLGGPDPSLWVAAALTGEMSSDGLGDLCVGLVRETGDRFSRVAVLPGPAPEPPAEIDPTSTRNLDIDKLGFRFAPNETAFAVRASGEYNSTSTNVSWSTLYLFRRQGSRLSLIFRGDMGGSEIDKTSGGTDKSTAFIVRFGLKTTNGAYDLMLAPKGGRGRVKRYVWTGDRYVAAKG